MIYEVSWNIEVMAEICIEKSALPLQEYTKVVNLLGVLLHMSKNTHFNIHLNIFTFSFTDLWKKKNIYGH